MIDNEKDLDFEEKEDEEIWDESEPDDMPDIFAEIYSKQVESETLLKSLIKKIETKDKSEIQKNEIIDNMHKELTRHKNGLVDQIVNNVLLDIIQLIDANNKTIERFKAEEYSEENYKKLLNALIGISEDLTDALYRQNVEPFTITEDVDVKKQKIIKVILTNNKELDNKIAKSINPGYEKEQKVLRQERIAIYKYKESEDNQ